MAKTLQKPAFWLFSVGALVALVVLVSLGNWQVQRLAWKEQLIADVTERVASAPVPAPGPGQWANVSRDSHVYRPVTLTGTYDHTREVHVWFALGKPQGGPLGGPGYMILTRFISEEGWEVIVNRGFVPEGLKSPEDRAQTHVEGPQTITGLMRFDEPKNWNSPQADKEKNVWIVRQVDEMAQFLAMPQEHTAPYWIDLTEGQGIDGLPQGGETRVVFTNNHLQYALTWFGLAVVLVVVFAFWLFKALREPKENSL